jgi:hypothetical protein
MEVFYCENKGKNVTFTNRFEIDELYDLENEIATKQKSLYIANQFIHAYSSYLVRDAHRNWSDIYLVSDFDRNKYIWRVPISEIRKLFLRAGNDYPNSIHMTFNEKKQDYDVTVDLVDEEKLRQAIDNQSDQQK